MNLFVFIVGCTSMCQSGDCLNYWVISYLNRCSKVSSPQFFKQGIIVPCQHSRLRYSRLIYFRIRQWSHSWISFVIIGGSFDPIIPVFLWIFQFNRRKDDKDSEEPANIKPYHHLVIRFCGNKERIINVIDT